MRLRRSHRADEPAGVRVERRPSTGEGVSTVWRIRSLEAARQVLRARHATTQAGFTAEAIPQGRVKLRPILISDGPLHDEQRTKVARYFAPRVVERRYVGDMTACARRLLAATGRLDLEQVALLYTVEVTAAVVGLTESDVARMARRLVSFFRQPPFDIARRDLGRTRRQWAAAAWRGLWPVARFHLFDVRPAVRARRRAGREDVISHLIAEGYGDADILVECVTYGTAGMVTTREFIAMASWYLLTDDVLRARYAGAPEAERHAILHEIMRVEPVVGHLYRRATAPITVTDGEDAFTIEPGDLVDVAVRPANADERAVGSDPLAVCPGRPLPSGVHASALSFGDGAHACPGRPLAIIETDVFLRELLGRSPRLVTAPSIGWDDLIAGYSLRGMVVELGS